MTVSAVNPSVGYIGNGATTVYSYSFEVTDEASLVVTRVTISSLAKTVLTLDVDYTVDLTNSEVTLLTAPASTVYTEIRRAEPYVQDTSYDTQGNFSPTTLEDALDYLTMLVQQVNQWLVGSSNVVRLPTFTVATVPSALTAAPALIYVRDASGGGIPCFSDGTNWRRVDTRGIVS
jgi:hypothetical protein